MGCVASSPNSNRFAPLANTETVLVGPTVPDSVVDALQYDLTHGDTDTDSVATILVGDVEHEDPAEENEVGSVGRVEDVASEAEEEVTFQLPGASTRRAGFVSLDAVAMEEEFDENQFRDSSEALIGLPCAWLWKRSRVRTTSCKRGWKLFLLLPRLLLHRSPRRGTIPRSKLLKRFDLFNRGEWISLLEACRACCDEAAVARRLRGRRAENDMPSRISRAEALVHMGEFSSARQALEGSAFAPGSEATLNVLWDPLKRPPVPRDPMPRHLAHPEGRVLFIWMKPSSPGISGQLAWCRWWAFRDDSGASNPS